jgi:hypothetical protein
MRGAGLELQIRRPRTHGKRKSRHEEFCLDAAEIEDHTPAPSRAMTVRENEKVE